MSGVHDQYIAKQAQQEGRDSHGLARTGTLPPHLTPPCLSSGPAFKSCPGTNYTPVQGAKVDCSSLKA